MENLERQNNIPEPGSDSRKEATVLEKRDTSDDSESIETRAETLSDQISKYKNEEWVKILTHKLIQNFRDKHPGKLPVFNSEFQKDYIAFKEELVAIVKKIADFLLNPSGDKIEEIQLMFVEIDSTIEFDPSWYRRYIEEFEMGNEVLNIKNEELFKQITGKKPSDYVECSQHGNTVVLKTYCDKDYFACWESRKKAKESAGYYLSEKVFIIKGDKKIVLPLIVIRAGIDPDLDYDIYDSLSSSFREFQERVYTDETGREPSEESEWPKFESWSDDNGYGSKLWTEFLSDEINHGIHEHDLKDDMGYKIDDHIFEIEITETHEIQHHKHQHILLETRDMELKIQNVDDLKRYFGIIESNFLIRLKDELIAYMKEKLDRAERFSNETYLHLAIPSIDDLEEDEELDDETAENLKVVKGILKVRLPNSLYFYPNDHKGEVLRDIKEQIGQENFTAWKIDELYTELVIEEFKKEKKKFEKLTTAFLSEMFFHGSDNNSQKIIDILEIEPIQNWPVLHRWFKNNPYLFKPTKV